MTTWVTTVEPCYERIYKAKTGFLAFAKAASKLLAQAIHEADLADERFGLEEAIGVDRVFLASNSEKRHGHDCRVLRRNSITRRC
jgi:hypothetical protein